jgi:hypothetical protein
VDAVVGAQRLDDGDGVGKRDAGVVEEVERAKGRQGAADELADGGHVVAVEAVGAFVFVALVVIRALGCAQETGRAGNGPGARFV